MKNLLLNTALIRTTRWCGALLACLLALQPHAVVAGPFSAGNLAVIQGEGSGNNTNATVIELNTTTAAQSAVQSITIDGSTMPNAMRFSASASSTMYLSLNNDGTLLIFNGANTNDGAANVNTYLKRAVGSLNPMGTFAIQTTYTGATGNQTRSASSVDNINWLIGDQAGIYTNGATAASGTGNMRGIKSFGGTVYGMQASASLAPVGTVTATAYTGLTGLAVGNANKTDFYLISSGSNGSTNDILYTVENSSATVGVISKYSLVSGSWTANGTYSTTNGGFGLVAQKNGSGAYLYMTAGNGASTANSVIKLTDTAGYNSTISITTSSNVTLYTAATGKLLKGIGFAPNGIVTSGTLSALSTAYGTASASSSVSVSGAGLTADIVVTAPSGFEVSTTAGSGYGASVTLTQSGGTVSATTIYVRLAATTTVGSYSGNVVCTSTGVVTQNVAVPSSTVSAKSLTITGLSGVDKNYSGTTTASLTGTAALSGLLAGDVSNVTLGGSPTASFATAGVGTAKAITVSGYAISGSAAANYSLTQPTGLTANINQTALTITANNVPKALGATLTGGSGSTAFTSSGLVNSETIGTVTIAYGTGAAAGDSVGTYTGSVTPSAATGGTFTAANYAISYVAGDIVVTASPSITVAGTLAAVNATYGSASPTPTSFTASGANLTGNLTVTAPTSFEVSTTAGSGYGSSLNLTASGGIVGNTTIYVRLAAGPLVGSYSGNVSVSGGGATTQTAAIPSSTVSAKGLTITGLSGVTKVYDRNNTATLTGTAALSGVVSGDESNVSLTGTPSATFATVTVGTNKAITVTGYSLTGSAAAQYSLAQPTGLTADITAKPLTISSAAVTTRTYDGTTNATITGTLSGVISPDVVTFTGTGNFASAGPGVGIAVTSTSTLGGADAGNYSLTQPTGLTGTISGSANADLSALTVNGGQLWLSPTFASGTTNYTTYPDHATNSISITPTLADTNATIKVNGTTVASGTASGAISLVDGTNIITIVVTAQDAVTIKTNTIYAIRSTAPLLAGAIAFTGFNADGNDDIAFVALTNLPANTVIHFSDNAWNGSAIGSGGAFSGFTESEWVWIAPAGGLAAGTIVAINNVSATTTTTIGTVEFADAANRGLSTTAETVYAFQGSTHVPTVFLAGISSETGTPFANTGLSSGAAVTLSSSSDGARYKGARSGQTTFAGYLALIADVANNWDDIGNGDGTTYLPFSTTAFTATAYDSNVSINDVSVTEGDVGTKTLTFTVTRTSSAGAFTVDFTTTNGTATTANSDYVATNGTLTFTAGGSLTQTIDVTINGDTTAEADETFFVNLTNVVNTLGTVTLTKSQGTGTILNDDPIAPSISVQPASQTIATGSAATLSVTASGTPTPTYQWYLGTSGTTTSPIANATNASYTSSVLLASTSYWVRVSNSAGTADSSAAVITTSYQTPYASTNLAVLAPNTAAWNPAGVTINGTTFINLGLQGMGRVPASAIDSATGESLGSISDMQITGWKKNVDGSYSGTLNTLPDRGYNNGATFSNYRARLNNYAFTFTPYTNATPTSAQNQVALTFTGSTPFTYDNGSGQKYTTGLPADGTLSLFGTTVPVAAGTSTQSDGTVTNRLTLDSEGLALDRRAGKSGAGWIGDEYGASIYHFNSSKQIDGQLILPAALIPHSPVGTVNFNGTPVNGRRDNQGVEGLAQSPDGTRLFALMQSATIQDTGSGNQGRYNTRLLVYDISSTDTPNDPIAQYVIQLPRIDTTGSTSNGTTVDKVGAQSSIVALSTNQILILSRDGNGRGSSGSPVFKSVLLADLSSASNIDGTYDAEGAAVAPGGTLTAGVTPLAWTEALNLVGKLGSTTAEVAKFGLNLNDASVSDTNTICEKWEALTLVSANDAANPNDYFLFVGNDNDFLTRTGKYLDASGTVQSYDAGLENDSIVLVWRVRMTSSFNQPPFVANAIADQTAVATVAFSFTFATNAFADPEGQTLTYTATKSDDSALPSWLTFNPGTRTFSGTPTSGDVGTLTVKLTATDNGSPNLFGSATFTITTSLDSTAPTINLSAPSASITAGGPVTYTVTYADANFSGSTLANGNITLNKTGTANGSVAVTGTGTTRTVTISSITGDGTIGISVAAGTASDTAGNTAPAAGPSTTFTVDNTVPSISIGSPSVSSTTSGPVTYTVTYADANFNSSTLANGNITLNKTGTANGSVAVTGSGTTRTVTIGSITGTGSLGISVAGGTASDTAGNTAAAAGPSTTFTVTAATPDIVIYLTGSTAFRSVAYAAIASLYDTGFTVNAANGSGAPFTTIANPQAPNRPSADSLFNEASFVTFSGTMPTFGSQVVVVNCNWGGSVAGLRDVAQQNTRAFLSTALSQTSAFTDNGTNAVPDFCLSDVNQTTTVYKSPTLQSVNFAVVPYVFVKNNGASGTLTNITHQQAQTLFANGVVSLGSITGDATTGTGSDTNKVACLIGANNGSGGRALVFADTGYGALKSTFNYKYDGTNTFVPVVPDPNVGYTSVGSIRADLSVSASQAIGADGSTTVTGYALGYLSVKDAYSVTGNSGGALNLQYDGSAFSTNAVQNGTYTLWGYERISHRSGINANLTSFRGAITNALISNLGTGTGLVGIPLQSMKVQRSVDGGPISTLY